MSEPFAFTMKNQAGRVIVATAEELSRNPEWVRELWKNAQPLYLVPEERRITLSSYINAGDISAADLPHTVVEKLQRAIDEAHPVPEAVPTRPPADIVGNIVADICCRAGLRHAWEDIDDDIRDEIVEEWLSFFQPQSTP